VASVNNRKKIGLKRGEKQYDNVLALLRKAYNGCKDEDEVSQDITLYPLTQNKVLAEVLCVRGAYQRTNYYAVLDDKLSKVEQILAGLYNEAGYDEKQGYAFVRGTYKGRGLGDCLGGQDAAWNGKIFIRTSKWTTGSCKGFGGGAWQLPIFVSDIVVK
jgi:raw score 12.19